MSSPTSFRLPPELLVRLDEEAGAAGSTVTALVSSLLDEGLKTRRFPGVVYRPGPAGRRAGLVGGPDVWEIVRAVRQASGEGEERIREVVEERGISAPQVRLAVDFYLAFPAEIDDRIAADDRAAVQVREVVEKRHRLMSG